jgi:NADH-quinone oxidoreductase subunit N
MMSQLPIMLPAYAEIFIAAMACLVLLVDLYLPDRLRDVTYGLSLLTLLGAAACTVGVAAATGGQPAYTFNGMFVSDIMASVLKVFTYLSIALCLVYSRTYLTERGLYRGEFFVLTLFATLGMMVMISANHFLTMYLGLELMSLCLYALIALDRDSAVSTEAAMKYFVLGALSSGLLLYGMSMMYGATGSLDIAGVARALEGATPNRNILVFGLVFMVAGVAFKLGVVPFHMWIPDVYHGAPTAMTLIIGSAPKLAAFAMAVRLLVGGLGTPLVAVDWQQMLVILAVLSMAIGNLAAIAQTNIKRMLAYSTISHMGFMLLGLLSGVVGGNRLSGPEAYGAAMFYSVAYVITALAAFGMVVLLARRGFEADNISDFKGLNRRSPWYAFIMLLTMFSLAGVPPTVGFYAKVAVFSAVIQAGELWLAVVGVVFSLIGAFYYIRVVKVMYFDEPEPGPAAEPIRSRLEMDVLLSANGLAMLALGIFPGPLLQLCFLAMRGLG